MSSPVFAAVNFLKLLPILGCFDLDNKKYKFEETALTQMESGTTKCRTKMIHFCHTETKVSSLGGMTLSIVWRIAPACHLGFLNQRNHSCTRSPNLMSRDHGMYPGTGCAWDRGNRSAGSTLPQLPKGTPNHFEGSHRNLVCSWNKQCLKLVNKITTTFLVLGFHVVYNLGELVKTLTHSIFCSM